MRVKVLQGQSVLDGGIWYTQGAVLNATADHGEAVEQTADPVNTPPGILPTKIDAPAQPVEE